MRTYRVQSDALGAISTTPATRHSTIATVSTRSLPLHGPGHQTSIRYRYGGHGPGGLGSYVRLLAPSVQQLAARRWVRTGERRWIRFLLRYTFTTGHYIWRLEQHNIQYDHDRQWLCAGGLNSIGDYRLRCRSRQPCSDPMIRFGATAWGDFDDADYRDATFCPTPMSICTLTVRRRRVRFQSQTATERSRRPRFVSAVVPTLRDANWLEQ